MRGIIPTRFPASETDLLEYIFRTFADQQIHCVISLRDQVDLARLENAIRLTLDAEPVLGCRFVERFRRPFWERRKDLDHIRLCTLKEVAEPEQSLMDFMTMPTDPRRDPLIQVLVLRSRTDTLCIKVDHVAADAGGVKEYAYLLSSLYQRLNEDPEYKPFPNIRGDRGMKQVFKQISLAERLLAMPGLRRPPMTQGWGFPWVSKGVQNRTFMVRHIGPDRFKALRKYCREHQVTVNDIMLTVFYRALFEMTSPRDGVSLHMQVAIDLRRFLLTGQGEAICNLAGAVFPNILIRSEDTFDATLNHVNNTMNKLKAKNPGLATWLFLDRVIKVAGFSFVRSIMERMRGYPPLITNLGVLDNTKLDLGDSTIDHAYMVSPIPFPPSFAVGFASFNDSMTITIGYCEAESNRSVVKSFLDLTEGELATACST